MVKLKILAVFLGVLFTAGQAAAQQPPVDEKLAVAMQLLNERTGQVIELAAEVQKLGKQLQEARAELAKGKTPPPAKP
ncbi:hypothetical protein UFOVP1413_52 [uncultured Caudovirales phage]|uniref:Uncharacterized protein n=1 Tax=uncultured Caudovirales phage TaxID=2100421 RepID=A0A6J5SB68_9CAUD|nr:hypothetical protein UFOVP893_52 [uncultured Caudovirales phage]CAB4210822.1 hypothetical protein UFOVP1413_52 [uncultured Caudovirales phage]